MPAANFADPEFEPSDEELCELSREAFADVARLRAVAQGEMRGRIAVLRAEAMARVAALVASESVAPSEAR